MKTMILAAAAVLSLGIGAAYAGNGDGTSGPTFFTSLPGVVPAVSARPAALALVQDSPAIHAYVTHQQSAGTWLFPPNQFGGGSN